MTIGAFRVIGRGRAGGGLALALTSVGWTEVPARGRGDDLLDAGVDADLVIIATPDSEIAAVSAQIETRDDTVVIHLAGSRGLEDLAGHPRAAALHPLMTLPTPEAGAERLLSGGWFAVAGDPLAAEIVEQFGGQAITVDDAERARYHATAAVASNHLVALMGQVERLADLVGIPFEAYLALAQASLENVGQLGPASALTGPAARGDTATIEAHLAAIPPEERELYLVLAQAAAGLAGRHLDVHPDAPADSISDL